MHLPFALLPQACQAAKLSLYQGRASRRKGEQGRTGASFDGAQGSLGAQEQQSMWANSPVVPSSPSCGVPRPSPRWLSIPQVLRNRFDTAEIRPLAKITGGQSKRTRFPFISPLLLPLIALLLIPISFAPGLLFTPNITDVVSN